MNLREGRIGNQEGVALAAIAATMNAVFSCEGVWLFRTGNRTYASAPAAAAISLVLFLLAAKAPERR